MDIRQLNYFIAIAEERSISGAARRLHMTQPPLSQQFKAMETELGTKLAYRNGKLLEITEAGKALYEYALQMTQLMEEAKLEVREVGNGVHGRLTLGVNTFSVATLPQVLIRFQQQFPKVTYKIQQNESAYLCQLVRERVIELAFIRLPLDLDDFSVLHLYTEPFYLITAPKQQMLGQGEVQLAELANERLLLPSTQGLGVHYLILEAFSRHEIEPNIAGECSDIMLLMQLVSSGFCSAVVPETLLKHQQGYAFHARKIAADAEISSPLGLIWLKNHRLSGAAQHFITLFKKEAAR